ncbi:hypothetical protein EDD16DRAFT_1519624 [Pisolithus croceorrhizus]|nr:hypothetical protein EV401DRAFT_1895750 [Pisolithus croceorrhizus]KAI6119074.1 hypothetical protein EDD16DRAFT_1519624 [Pisolithus croceorrhizus]
MPLEFPYEIAPPDPPGESLLHYPNVQRSPVRHLGRTARCWTSNLDPGSQHLPVVTSHPSDSDTTYDVRLKGAGRTPFSRSVDGLAVLRSSMSEYLCSEVTSHSGSYACIGYPYRPVSRLRISLRERLEKACVTTRVAKTFIRIGDFEALPPPCTYVFLWWRTATYQLRGSPNPRKKWTVNRVPKLDDVHLDAGSAWRKELIFEATRKNAKMVVAWQAYGFMHNVINTDKQVSKSVSVAGLTANYGKDRVHSWTCSTPTTYATTTPTKKQQTNMFLYACRVLFDALALLIGAGIALGNKAVQKRLS